MNKMSLLSLFTTPIVSILSHIYTLSIINFLSLPTYFPSAKIKGFRVSKDKNPPKKAKTEDLNNAIKKKDLNNHQLKDNRLKVTHEI
jgi:hypothetical protein